MTFWHQWNLGKVNRTVLDEKNRKVKFTLNSSRQHIKLVEPAGNGNPREVLSLIFEGSTPDEIKIDTLEILVESQSDGAVLNAQPAV